MWPTTYLLRILVPLYSFAETAYAVSSIIPVTQESSADDFMSPISVSRVLGPRIKREIGFESLSGLGQFLRFSLFPPPPPLSLSLCDSLISLLRCRTTYVNKI
jgi:hypothetical protein